MIYTSFNPQLLQKTLSCVAKNFQKRCYTPRRALLYVPGNDSKKLTKAFGLDVDCIAMDCEDGVAINQKSAARATIRGVLNTEGKPAKEGRYDLAVRVNSVDSGLFKDDLSEILSARNLPDTILLPKVNNKDHLRVFSDELNKNIANRSHNFSKLDLIMYVESAQAFINLNDIIKTSFDLSSTKNTFKPAALVFGSDDFCADIGATRTESSIEILYARQKLVLMAKAYRLQAMDMVHINFKDLEGLRRISEEGARMGFTGKQVIHPGQVPVVQKAFLPTQGQVEWASGLLEAFDLHQKQGKGAFTYRNSMIDMPTVKQAENVISLINSVKKTLEKT